MTTYRDKDSALTFECDQCGETASDDDDEGFMDFWDGLKAGGWRARNLGEGWEHACPDCHFDQ